MDLESMTVDLSSLMGDSATDDNPFGDDSGNTRTVQVKRTINQHAMRRVLSELALEKELPWHFEQGVTYHCLSWGDVDSLTYFRTIVKQQHVFYALISSWCMASEDIAEIRNWRENGYVDRVDFYIGEIFKASYRKQYEELKKMCRELGGRVCMFRNHSKIMVILGERFDATIESSANVNTNPRTEQAAITVDTELALWYKNIFDGFQSFERHFDDVKPFEVAKKEAENEEVHTDEIQGG